MEGTGILLTIDRLGLESAQLRSENEELKQTLGIKEAQKTQADNEVAKLRAENEQLKQQANIPGGITTFAPDQEGA